MTEQQPAVRAYVLQCANRTTGETSVEIIDATTEDEAIAFASARGLIVASVTEHHPSAPGDKSQPPDKNHSPKRSKTKRRRLRQTERHWYRRIWAMGMIGLIFWVSSVIVFSQGGLVGVAFGAALFVSGSIFIALGELGFVLSAILDRMKQSLEAKDDYK